jgi:hypothetical protein
MRDALLQEVNSQVPAKSAEEVFAAIVQEAYGIWKNAGCLADFCIRFVDVDTIGFGKGNRVIWSICRGYRVEHK